MTRRSQKAQEAEVINAIKKRLALAVLIPVTIALAFMFFGPAIGSLFGFISKYRNEPTRVDEVAPSAPIFKTIDGSVKETQTKLEGFAEPGTTIKIYVNGPEFGETITASDGIFTFEQVDLIKGRNTVSAKAIDENGNESDRSETLTLTVDEEKPELEILSPKDGDVIRNLDKRIEIKGEVSEKVKILINDRSVITKPDLTFSFFLGVNEGDVKITIVATDEAGNEVKEELNVKYVKGS
jgi:hypothetical protein